MNETKTPHSYHFSHLDSLLIQNQDPIFGGNVSMIVRQGDRTIYEKHLLKDWDQTAVLPVASSSKWVSAAIVLILVDQQLLDLDQRIGYYLPIFDQYGKGDPSLRQCFSLTSGFDEQVVSPSENFVLFDKNLSLEQCVDKIAKEQKLVFPAGTKFFYGGVGMQIVGRIAEKVSGKSWERLAEDLLFKPCEMLGASYGSSSNNPLLSGGLRCSLADYVHFLDMIGQQGRYQGKQIISAKQVQTFWTLQASPTATLYSPYPNNPPFHPYQSETIGYGFGSWLDVMNPQSLEIEQISSPGVFGTYPWIDRKRNVWGIVFCFQRKGFTQAVLAELEMIDAVRRAIDKN